MKWNDEVSGRFKWWFITGLAFVFALIFIACRSGSPASAATTTVTAAPRVTAASVVTLPPVTFSKHLTKLDPVTARALIGSTGVNRKGPCWQFNHNWPVEMNVAPHKQMYAPGIDVLWCANRARTKIRKLDHFFCFDAGGFYDYDGCTKQKGGTGLPSLGLSSAYRYHWTTFPNVTDTRTPSIVFSVYPNGRIAGTVYYDN